MKMLLPNKKFFLNFSVPSTNVQAVFFLLSSNDTANNKTHKRNRQNSQKKNFLAVSERGENRAKASTGEIEKSNRLQYCAETFRLQATIHY
jgi:hypothetical protein